MTTEQPQVKYLVRRMERCICATFVFGEDSFESPYISIYFIVNNSGVIAVYDKSLPVKKENENGPDMHMDSLQNASMELKKGVTKYEVMDWIYEELSRIGEKLEREGRALQDSDVNKLMTKLGSKFQA